MKLIDKIDNRKSFKDGSKEIGLVLFILWYVVTLSCFISPVEGSNVVGCLLFLFLMLFGLMIDEAD